MLADRATHAFLGRGEISFSVIVRGDSIVGTASARFFDAAGAPSDGPIAVEMLGSRVTLP
jgi:DNA-binding transcriptional regulator LsrR (DeoR family)